MHWWDKIADWTIRNLSPRYASVIAIVTGILLFGSKYFPTLGLEKIVTAYRPWIGLAFLFSTVLTASYPVWEGVTWGKARFESRNRSRETQRYLRQLPVDQLRVLYRFAHGGNNAVRLGIYSGAAPDLVAKGILVLHPQPAPPPTKDLAYNLTPVAAKVVLSSEFREMMLADEQA